MSIDLNKINLRKNQVIDLKKSIGIENQKSNVVLALDFSGSMSNLYQNGTVQETIERLLPVAMALDDNAEIDFYLFENNCQKLPENITLYNLNNYIQSNVLGKYSMGGTQYAPVVNKIVDDFGNRTDVLNGIGSKISNFFGINSKTINTLETSALNLPTYVIFITDGENTDREHAEKAIKDASRYGIFFQFVGIGNESFNFLRKLDDLSGRLIDNANFFKVPDLNQVSDNKLYSLLLNEFPSWLKLAKNLNLVK